VLNGRRAITEQIREVNRELQEALQPPGKPVKTAVLLPADVYVQLIALAALQGRTQMDLGGELIAAGIAASGMRITITREQKSNGPG
jgi:hypothetical protein